MRSNISQRQLVIPLLESLLDSGGSADTRTLYDQVAEKVGVDPAVRQCREKVGSTDGVYNLFERHVRWGQQRGKLLGLMAPISHGHWQITSKGKQSLRSARPGVVVTVFEASNGIALFGRCEDAIGYIDDGSVQLILTSPPYPLIREKAYGNELQEDYLDWFVNIAREWPKKLTNDGSIVLNLADVWERGRPTQSLYQERLLIRLFDELGLRLCQRFAWLNPSKLPAPAEWVTIRRVRVKPALEQIYWLSPHDNPYADNRSVLNEYSESMMKRLAAGGERGDRRPSGHVLAAGSFSADRGGSIPGNLLVAANTNSQGGYIRYCREHGLPVHPARFPEAIPEFFIRFLTREGDVVYDPFSGSLTTSAVAQQLRRNWIGSEAVLEYLDGGVNGRIKPITSQPVVT